MPEATPTYQTAVAVVTGAASGIGAALAKELGRRGATVVLGDRQLAEAEAIAGAIGKRAAAVEVDVRDADAVEHVIAQVVDRHGRIDFLFNNAGIGVGGETLVHTVDDWRYMIDVNVMGVVHGVQAAYPRMVAQGFGHIVNTASMAGLTPAPLAASYGTAKHAVVGLTRALRVEAAEHGVRVSALCPGTIRTPILEGGRYGRILQPIEDELRDEIWERTRPMDVDAFAAGALDQVAANREIIILPTRWRAAWLVYRLVPGLVNRLLAKAYRDLRSRLGNSAKA